ncbi:MAG: FtsX-like permease family protein [Bacilli bacterium]
MKILNKVTLKNLFLNKKRTIVTIIGVMLSTALICAVAGMVSSFQETMVAHARYDVGDFHLMVSNIKKDDEKFITNRKDVKEYFKIGNIGFGILPNSNNEYKPYLNVISIKENEYKKLGIKITKGRYPVNNNELLISDKIITDAGSSLKVGDKFTLEIGKRYNTLGEVIDKNVLYDKSETLKTTEIKEYTVVGIMERPNVYVENFSCPGYSVVTKEEKFDDASIALLLNNPKDYLKVSNSIEKENKAIVDFNSDLLRWTGVTLQDETLTLLYSVVAFVITIIIITSVYVIKNSFNISITEKTKQYGMLASIGATSKQIKKNVLFEGFFIGLIGIPLGILCGIIAVIILLFLINIILGEFLNNIKFVFDLPLIPIILTIFLSSITIYLSTIFVAFKASKISPIDAIRSNDDIKINSKKLKTPKVIKKLFKTGGVIAYKNLKRNKKKYRTTVVSITLSIFIFITLSSFLNYGLDTSRNYYEEINYNVELRLTGNDNYETMINDISKFSDVNHFGFRKNTYLLYDYNKYVTDIAKRVDEANGIDTSSVGIMVVALGEKEYSRYIKELKLDYNDIYDKGILIDNINTHIKDEKVMGNVFKLNVKDTLVAGDYNIVIGKKTSIKPMGLEYSSYSSGLLIVSDEYMEKFKDVSNHNLFMKTDDSKKLVTEIKTYLENKNFSEYQINDLDEFARSNNALVLIISIFLYGFIIVISLIGVTNIFNTISTSMMLRSKEFAMLKSIGMTSKEFNRMIRLESLFYGLKSLLIGIPLGILGSFGMYISFNSAGVTYKFPLLAILISILFVFIIISIIMKYSIKKINKSNIIETIRNDNI